MVKLPSSQPPKQSHILAIFSALSSNSRSCKLNSDKSVGLWELDSESALRKFGPTEAESLLNQKCVADKLGRKETGLARLLAKRNCLQRQRGSRQRGSRQRGSRQRGSRQRGSRQRGSRQRGSRHPRF